MPAAVNGPIRMLIALVVVLIVLLPHGQATAQDDRTASVAGAAVELSRIERSGDLLLLHDRLHPDVRLVVSRSALSTWYDSPGAVIPTADPEILSVEFGSWVWPATGQTYTDVATVTVRQPGVRQGAEVEQVEVQHYWFDGTSWRWFFGSDQAFIDSLEQQGPQDASPTGTITDIEYARVDMVWAEIYAEAGIAYHSPAEVNSIASLPVQTGCGWMTDDSFAVAFYCLIDQEIYYMAGFQQGVERQFGRFAWLYSFSHEWAHHIQLLQGIGPSEEPELDGGLYVIELELQADCLAGVYAQEAVARGWYTEADLEDALRIIRYYGDQPGTSFDDPLAHGSVEQRQQAFTTGLEDGLVGCDFDLTPNS